MSFESSGDLFSGGDGEFLGEQGDFTGAGGFKRSGDLFPVGVGGVDGEFLDVRIFEGGEVAVLIEWGGILGDSPADGVYGAGGNVVFIDTFYLGRSGPASQPIDRETLEV